MDVIQWLIEGFPVGCVYALVAIGLVLTYKTTGVFNLAFSAQAFFSAWVMYDFVELNHRPLWLGFVVSVLIAAPALGFVLDRALFRYMRTASGVVKLVTALGLFVAIPEIVKAVFDEQAQYGPPSVAPLIGIAKNKVFHIGDYVVAADRMTTVIVTLVVVVALGLLFRYTAIGLRMRAVVESPRMVELAGVDSERTGTMSWMLSSFLAGLAGVLLAPLFATLDANNYTLLIVAAIAAAAVGRLNSIPMTLLGGLILGIGQRALPDVLSQFGIGVDSSLSQDLRPAFPFLLLFLLLIFWPALRNRREVTDPLAGVDPPPPAVAAEYKNAELQRTTKIMFPIFITGFLVVMMTLVTPLWVNRLTLGFVLAVIFLSITVFTGFGGQISLAQATFAGIGGFTMANLAHDWGIPVLLATLMGAVLAAAVGALLAVPALRLGGIYLTLATLAFGLMVEQVVFNREDVSNGEFGLGVSRPEFARGDRAWFLLVFGIFAIVGFLVIFIRKGTTGRFFAALRGSETAAASIGINATRQRIVLFALSSGIAGLGGGLLAMHDGTIYPSTYPVLLGAAWVVLVVTLGTRTVDGAVNAAIGFVVFQWLLTDALQLPGSFPLILFGLGAITYARHPEGIVELQTRKAILAQVRGRAFNVRAKAMAAAGRVPREFTPSALVVVPVAAGPVLYTLYVFGRSLGQGHWVTVHSPTLLAFVLPSVAFLLAWIFRTDLLLRRAGGYARGPQLLLAGGVVGALVGLLFNSQGWAQGSALDDALVGLPVGIALVAFTLLPCHYERIAAARDWRDPWVTWRDGRTPSGFVLAGVYLFHRVTTDNPPGGWPVYFVAAVSVITWLQWVAAVQGACNELWLGPVGGEDEAAVEAAPVAAEVPAATPVGGGMQV
ncbi:MAG TPA: ABC transporter permease [Acidimicrobiia bacterium]|nr:ABC transporter permease [Acidimicrobiia bacterium]